MSKQWSRHSFRPAAPGETVMGRPEDERPIGPRSFSPQNPVSWQNADGFVRRGEGFAPASTLVTPRATPDEIRASFVPFAAFGAPPEPAKPAVNDDAEFEPEVEAVEATIEPPQEEIIRAEAFAAGFAEGERMAHAAMSGEAAACARLIVGLTRTTQFDRPALAHRLQLTVLHLVRQMIGETSICAERLTERVDNAISMLADVTEAARVHLHPNDAAMLADHMPSHVAIIANPQIERGGFRLETLSATVEDGPTLWMEQLASALDKVPFKA